MNQHETEGILTAPIPPVDFEGIDIMLDEDDAIIVGGIILTKQTGKGLIQATMTP